MLFSSLVFLFVFLPILLVVYYVAPSRYRNAILLFFSLGFYAWGGVSYSLILISSILINYVVVKQIEKRKGSKIWLGVGLSFNILLIVTFKYLNFFIQNINTLTSCIGDTSEVFPELKIILPLGISFFTFQQMSLLWDVYRGHNRQSPTLLNTALYVSFFPQLVAGPIIRYNEIISQIKQRNESIPLLKSGILKFILGLFKKIAIANTCGILADTILSIDQDRLDAPFAWAAIIAYSIQIYFDFSGYSDMAIGLGRMFGFRIAENFNFPYTSKSIQEFWQRWHISLSTWFKEYVYIPLGGNRKATQRTYLNLFIVFLLTGFWHGATWSFVFWGIYHGFFISIERLFFKKILKKTPAVISTAYTLIIVIIGWVFFRIENFREAMSYVGVMFGKNPESNLHLNEYLSKEILLYGLIAFLFSSRLPYSIYRNIRSRLTSNQTLLLQIIIQLFAFLLFLFTLMLLSNTTSNPFIYFLF